MDNELQRKADRLLRTDSRPAAALELLMDEVRVFRNNLALGLAVAWVLMWGLSYVLTYLTSDYWIAYLLGAAVTGVGLAILTVQLLLTHRDIHRAVFRPSNRLGQVPPPVVLACSLLFFFPVLLFIPTDSAIDVWRHPLIAIVDAAIATSLGLSVPYFVRLADDYNMVSESTPKAIWRNASVLLAVYLLASTVAIVALVPDLSVWELAENRLLVLIPLIGLLYSLRIETEQKQSVDYQKTNDRQIVDSSSSAYLDNIIHNRLTTLLAAVVSGIGLLTAAGASAGRVFSTGPAPGDFLFYGAFQLMFLIAAFYILPKFVIRVGLGIYDVARRT